MVIFPDSLTAGNVSDFHKELLSSMDNSDVGSEIVFELGALNELDFSGIQLIVSLCRTLDDEGRSYTFSNLTQTVENAFLLSGLWAVIGKGGVGKQ